MVLTSTSPGEAVETLAAWMGANGVERIGDEHLQRANPDVDLLVDLAQTFIDGYTGDFEFLTDIAKRWKLGAGLTAGQVRGILRCMAAQHHRAEREAKARERMAILADLEAAEAYAEFLAAGGAKGEEKTFVAADVADGIYTVVLGSDNDYVTLRLKPWNSRKGWRIVSRLCGPDNGLDFEAFASVDADGKVIVWSRYRNNERLDGALRALLAADESERTGFQEAYALASNRCSRCGRPLTRPDSIKRHMGADCAMKAAA